MKQKSVAFGYLSEERVIEHFKALGYELIAKRYKTQYGEIDIVMKGVAVLLFVEVKARSNGNFQDCVLPKQIKRNIDAANMFLAEFPEFENFELRYDLALIGRDEKLIQVMENAILSDLI